VFAEYASSHVVAADLKIHGYGSGKAKRVLLGSHPDYALPIDCRGEDLDGQLNGIADNDKQRARETWYALTGDAFENGAIGYAEVPPRRYF
jgi:hypothetical protein